MGTRIGTSRRIRASAAATIAVGVSLLFSPSARADTLTIVPDATAWFWMSNSRVTACSDDVSGTAYCATVSGTKGEEFTGAGGGVASPITTGHLGVALRDGTDDMRAYVHFDLGGVPLGATVDSMVVTLVTAQSTQAHSAEHAGNGGHAPATTNDAAALIKACILRSPMTDTVSSGGGGESPYETTMDQRGNSTTTKGEPNYDCSVSTPGKRAQDGATWTFDLSAMAQKWVSGEIFNNGIALVPDVKGVAPTWTVEFHGPHLTLSNQAGEDVEWVKKTDEPRARLSFSGGLAPPPPPPPIDTGGSPVFPIYAPPPPIVAPAPAPAPVSGAAPPVTPAVPVGATTETPGWVFGLLPLGLLGLATIFGSLGNDRLGLSAASGGGSRVASVLLARRVMGAGSTRSSSSREE